MLGRRLGGCALACVLALQACTTSDEAGEPQFVDRDRGDGRPDTRRRDADANDEDDEPRDRDASVDGAADDDAGKCPIANTCSSARGLGTLSGDVGAEQKSIQGTRSEWLSVRVTEGQTGFSFGARMATTISLLSPTGSNYDLYVYYDPLVDAAQCTTVRASSTQQSCIGDSVHLTWGEGAAPNGDDDSRTISIEVRHASGTCKPTSAWILLVEGNK
jgi:hypothetical protein